MPRILLLLFVFTLTVPALAQAAPSCEPDDYAAFVEDYSALLASATSADTAAERALTLSLALQERVAACGYTPTTDVRDALIRGTLAFATLRDVIAATSVGSDTDVAIREIETLMGDSFNGSLLYNGLVDGLDGGALGCAGCHNGETAPLVEGTWTRVEEIRLLDPALAGYDDVRYLVESIVHPNAYIAEGYDPNLMPDNFGNRLDAQQLADLIVFLQSQDQLEDETASP